MQLDAHHFKVAATRGVHQFDLVLGAAHIHAVAVLEREGRLPVECGVRMLITDADLQPGESVLIRGVGESIATAALQLALRLGAHTIVTADHPDNLSPALALGAAHGIDETKEDFPVEVRRLTGKRGVAVVVDCIGDDGWAKNFAALSRGGRLVTCGASAGAKVVTDVRRIFWNNLKVFGSSLGTRDEFRRVLNFLEATGTKPVIDKVYPLADAAHAHERLAPGGHFGKIVLRMNDSSGA